MVNEEYSETIAKKNWNDLSWWEKVTDKDPARPPKTIKNIFFWSRPITCHSATFDSAQSLISFGTMPHYVKKPKTSLDIRMRQVKGPTYNNERLYKGVRLVWVGFFWGWVNE